MAENNDGFTTTYKAAVDLSAARYHIMRPTGERTCNIASHAGAAGTLAAIGILQNAPGINQNASIKYAGESKVVAGGSVTVNAWITTNGSGRATAAASGDVVIGQAVTGASADGDVITARINQFRIGPIS